MAKKASHGQSGSSAKKSKKSKKRKLKAAKMNPLEILQWFVDNADKGVKGGVFEPKKHFADKVYSVHGPKMLGAISHALEDLGLKFDEKAKKGTGIVAEDMGRICRMLYSDEEISEDQFDAVRIFVSHHHSACKKVSGTGGGGDWCDY